MKWEEARQYVQRLKEYRATHSSATDCSFTEAGDALITLDNRITELEAERDELKAEIKSLKRAKRLYSEVPGHLEERMTEADYQTWYKL